MRLFRVLRSRRFNPECIGPIKIKMKNSKDTIKKLEGAKQWYCGGFKTAAIAAELLNQGKIIALPTDTIYGLAGSAQNDKSIARLYEIKQREESKPLAICLWSTEEISKWAEINNLPEGLINNLLPGPTTLILRRKDSLNPSLNPGIDNVGVRVPAHNFTRSVARMLNVPIALTSANVSNQQSTVHPSEFEDLWPELDGVFWEQPSLPKNYRKNWRNGSTIVDLTVQGEFNIVRRGIGFRNTLIILKRHGLKTNGTEEKNNDEIDETIREEQSENHEIRREKTADKC